MKVVVLTRVLAGPCCSNQLSMVSAEVHFLDLKPSCLTS
ncbi:uncharacterized protein METZ01_LOCUS35461 [marine metagenome]|uniref:Uncharacterized protein n=1 Tax=marine metagenome TaxID=408172 RepID=A0A381QY31_9ZZZZ